ncbi:hypothetical protein HYU13_04080 [Candidatus Woesearchaeota archaeon]|nr:hypothetical protein [Candidatus Woesearchaeota archaeon]
MLSWGEYIKKGSVKKTYPDKGKIRGLLHIADNRLKVMEKLGLDEENASVVFTNSYDSLRETMEGIAVLNGYNIYSHEALGLFFKEVFKDHVFYAKFDRLRILRNRVHYYGKPIPFEEARKGVEDMKSEISQLKLKYLQEVEDEKSKNSGDGGKKVTTK